MGTASGKVVLVTGAGRGYGPAIARLFADRGATVALHDVPDVAGRLAAELTAAGRSAFAVAAEATDPLAVQRMVDEVYRRGGRLDVLVTASELEREAALLAVTPEDWLGTFQRNVHGAFFAMQAAAKYMLLDRRGRIVNVTALAGTYPTRARASYAAAMGALDALTRALAVELAPKQIAVNAVAPGWAAPEGAEVPGPPGAPSPYDRVPLQRPVSPEDVAELAVFLASDDASYITGEIFYVDGGLGGRR